MKTVNWKLTLALFFLVIIFFSCKKKDSSGDPGVSITDEQKAAITNSYNEISSNVDTFLLANDPINKMNQYLDQIRNLAEVESAWVKDIALYVKFKNAGQVCWYIPIPYTIPPYGGLKSITEPGTRIPVGNKFACLINQQSNDESRPYCASIINDLDQEFRDNGYETTIVNAKNATLNFFQSSFRSYGAVFLITHGIYDGKRTWLVSGQEIPTNQSPLAELLNKYFEMWTSGFIIMGTLMEKRSGSFTPVKYYCFSDKFVSSSYGAGSLPNSLIYTVACQTFQGTTQLAEAYHNGGAGVFIGWDETNCAGQGTGKLLFDLLLGGMTVEEAFTALPSDSKLDISNDFINGHPDANLKFFPASGKDICLVAEKHAWIVITSPDDGQSYSDRVLNLEGHVDSVEKVINGIIEVNGVPTMMQLTDDTHFNQSIVINNGINTIKVTAKGKQSNGVTVVGAKQITINGTLANIDIFTELRWNTNQTDIDFHMLPPGGALGDLWTSTDCCYHYKNTSWGGYLDVDNTHGYGPEHISVPAATMPGTYRLFVHYYDDAGGGVTQAFVDVSAKNGPMQKFGPYTLVNDGGDNAGDLWEVCTVTFPGGAITPVNKYYSLGLNYKNSNLPPKNE